MAKKNQNPAGYQTAMEELQTIVASLEAEAISIDDLSEKAKRAAELIQFCRDKLRSTEEEITTLFSTEL